MKFRKNCLRDSLSLAVATVCKGYAGAGWAQQQAKIPDIALYKQAAQRVEARVHDFLGRMTVKQ
jgi:hypothetical protein